jgi:mycofactocin precursor
MPESATELLDRPDEETADATADASAAGIDEVVAADTLVEEISIDGMCGVY